MPARVLIIDDDRSMCEVLAEWLSLRGHQPTWRTSAAQAHQLLGERDFDVVLTDLSMEGMNGLELCERVVSSDADLPVIVVTAFGSMESAIGAIRAGAYDFVTKPVDMDTLALAVERAAEHRSLKQEVRRLRGAAAHPEQLPNMVGASPAMDRVADLVNRVAESDVNVLITGESGTGKELVARALHARSDRRHGLFVAVNCAAVPETLLESELFGHARGAFTDARAARAGLFVRANRGTLFLDEIGEIPLGMQVKLLRALQERKVRPVGGDTEVAFDARLLAATNCDIDTEVAEKRFRKDLYYRINVVRIDVPPLRTRGNDVLLLAHHFLEQAAERTGKPVVGLAAAAAEKLLGYDCPGNVRELENCIERAVALARHDHVTVEDLPEKIRSFHGSPLFFPNDDPNELIPMQQVEQRYIQRVLKAVGGNKTQAAKVLGFDRRTLYRKLERYGLS
jgi:two-component system response regulator AtoC